MRVVICAGLCLLAASLVHAAPPAAPVITVSASNIKELQFDWESVPQSNYYELWFRADAGSAWVKYAETPAQRPRFRIGVSVHLLDWRVALYRVKACNPSGCSTSNEVGVNGEQLAAMGYLKPRASETRRFFGGNVAVSADGKTIAAITTEDSDVAPGNSAAYVYRRGPSGWYLEARLQTSTAHPATAHIYGGDHVALSGDGNVLVVSAQAEDGPGADDGPPPQDGLHSGAVYLFRRSGATWALSQKLTGTNQFSDNFGYEVKVDDAGRTVTALHRWSDGVFTFGSVEVFRDPPDASNQFAHSVSVPVPVIAGQAAFCGAHSLSGDGNTIVRGCIPEGGGASFVQVLKGPGFAETARVPGGSYDGADVNYDGTVFLIQDRFDALAFRLGPSGWVSDGRLRNFAGEALYSRREIALSRDGKIAALGNWEEKSAGLGPVFPPYQAGSTASGGVVVYQRKANGWVVRRLVKPGSTQEAWAGHSVALGDNGRILVVGAPFDASAAAGINGDRVDDSAPERGAVWIY